MNVKKIKSANCTSKTNTYIVLLKNSFRYFDSATSLVALNKNFTFLFEENSCKMNSFRYYGSLADPVPLNPNIILTFEGNSCQRNRNFCQLT